MKFIEILKVFGYILVLLLCFVLLKGLSTFEYFLRSDKSVKYEQIWKEDFSDDLDTEQWILSDKDIKLINNQLVLSLSSEVNSQKATTALPELVDSGYVSVKIEQPLPGPQYKTSVELINDKTFSVPLEIHNNEEKCVEFRSPIVFGQELVSVSVSIETNHPNPIANSASTYPKLIIKELHFMKLVRPRKLF